MIVDDDSDIEPTPKVVKKEAPPKKEETPKKEVPSKKEEDAPMKVESPAKSPSKNILVKKAEADTAPKKGLLNFFKKKT